MNIKPSYLVTGGFGLIGSRLVNSLEGKITILSRTNKHLSRIKGKNIKIVLKDVQNINNSDLSGVDIIYHFASTVDNYNVLSNPYIDVEVNTIGTIRLLEMCKTLRKKPKIIYPSTFFVYGNEYERTKTPINEESKTEPLGMYPATKLCTESIIQLYSRLYDIPYLICRFTNVYGDEEEYDNKKKGALNYFIMQAIIGNTIDLYRGGNFYRDYIYVDDVVRALKLLETTTKNDIFLIGYGKSVLFRDIIEYVLKCTTNKSTLRNIEPTDFHKAVGIVNFVADTAKINSLGWHPKVDYKEGIKKVIVKYQQVVSANGRRIG